MTWEILPSASRHGGELHGPGFQSKNIAEGAKTGLVGLESVLAGIGGIPGALIEAPGQLTGLGYELLGRQPPEWAQGPVPLRIGLSGEPFIKTPEELQQAGGISGHARPETPLQEQIAPYGQLLGSLLGTGVNPAVAATAIPVSAAIRTGAEETGLQGPYAALAELAAITGLGARAGGKGKAGEFATPTGKQLASTAQAEGVTFAPAAIEAAGKRGASSFLRSIGRAGEKVQERAKGFQNQIEGAYRNVLGEVFEPYKTERNLQVLKEQTGKLFEPVEEIAAHTTERIPVSRLMNGIDDQIASLKKSKAPSDAEKAAMRYLEETKSNLRRNTDPAIKELDTHISQIRRLKTPTETEQALLKRLEQAKDHLIRNPTIDYQEGVRTFRSMNQQVQWDSPTRGDNHIRAAKEELRSDLRRHGSPDFVDAFDVSNGAWTELNRVGDATNILKGAVNPDGGFNLQGFHKAVKNPENRTQLEKTLGKPLFDRLEKISDLGEEGRKNFARVGAFLPEDMQSIHEALGHGGGLLSGGTVAGKLTNVFGRNFAARVLTNPNLQTNYIGYLGALRRESPRLTAYYIRRIQQDLASEGESDQGWELLD